MKKVFIISLFVSLASLGVAQELMSYNTPIKKSYYSNSLGDSIHFEIILPKNLGEQLNVEYPVFYLLDKQLEINYKYNLHTIDYLSTLQKIPKTVLIGISFSNKNRSSWTTPNKSGGKADDLIRFICNNLHKEIKKEYPISNFNLLIGHSRTAILSSYALSKRPDFFNGTIASSSSNFDFGDKFQFNQFESFLNDIDSSSHKYFYYFSVGDSTHGDLHESATDAMNSYLSTTTLPTNLDWMYLKHKAAHDVSPGLTVAKSLNEIFSEYGKRFNRCLKITRDSNGIVPWKEFNKLYDSISTNLGMKVQFSELFYNSMASEYYNDYEGLYGENNLHFSIEILKDAIKSYPNDYEYFIWIGEMYITLKEFDKGKSYLKTAEELLNSTSKISSDDKESGMMEIKNLKALIK